MSKPFKLLRGSLTCIGFLLLLVSSSFAKPLDTSSIPNQLKPWIKWVESKHPEWQCAYNEGRSLCSLPSGIDYVLSSKGASFKLVVETLKDKELVTLPAFGNLPSKNIQVISYDGRKANYFLHELAGNLQIRLETKGKYQIKGQFSWDKLPSELPLPETIALWNVDTSKLPGVLEFKRKDGKLWVLDNTSSSTKTSITENSASDSVDIQVMRLISDASPIVIKTRIILRISGRARPLKLGKVLPEGSVPVSVSSPIPYALNKNSELSLQVKAGVYNLELESMIPQPVTSIQLPAPGGKWPAYETLSFNQNPSFRSVRISGGKPIHSDATELPDNWKINAATLTAAPGTELQLKELSRGISKKAEDKFSLYRNIWPNFKTQGFSVEDKITARVHEIRRLNAHPETLVGRAEINNSPALITRDPETNAWGLELRSSNFELEAVSRYQQSDSIPAVGWQTEVSSLTGSLHLPPSWTLITIKGAAHTNAAWWDSWTLLEIFIKFLVIFACFKLFGRNIALLAGCAVILNHGEYLAPTMLFVYFLILVSWQKIIQDKKGIWCKLNHLLLGITFLALCIQGLAFAKLQFTQLIFPQLEAGTRYRSLMQSLYLVFDSEPLVWPALLYFLSLFAAWALALRNAPSLFAKIKKTVLFGFLGFISMFPLSFIYNLVPGTANVNHFAGGNFENKPVQRLKHRGRVPRKMKNRLPSSLDAVKTLASESSSGSYLNNFSTNATAEKEQFLPLSSGPAIPEWSWKSYSFYVDSPVSSAARLEVLTLSPLAVRIICGLRALLSFLLLGLLFLEIKKCFPWLSVKFPRTKDCTALLFCTLFLSAGLGLKPLTAYADFPSPEILKSLEERLSKNHCSDNNCSSIVQAKLKLTDTAFRLKITASSKDQSFVYLPGPLDVLQVKSITSSGKNYSAIRRSSDNFLVIKTPYGSSTYTVRGLLPKLNAFSLEFKAPVFNLEVNAPGWMVEGINASGSTDDSVRFTKLSTTNPSETSNKKQITTKSELVNWATIMRVVKLGDEIKVYTTVQRTGQKFENQQLLIPLLKGERLTSGQFKIENGKINLSFPKGVRNLQYSSIIPDSNTLDYIATPIGKDGPYVSEAISTICKPYKYCSYSGLNPVSTESRGSLENSWLPFPGEKLRFSVKDISAIKGNTLTIDSISHAIKWGSHLMSAELKLSARATVQRTLSLELEKGVSIKEIMVDGHAGSGISDNSKAEVLLRPGSHEIKVKYQKPFIPEILQKAPGVKVSTSANNLTVSIRPSANRWILWVGGTIWGPSVVFWPKLLMIICLIFFFRKVQIIPHSTIAGGIFLSIGLASLPIILLWIPLLWLFILVSFDNYAAMINKLPRLLRTVIFLFITVASLALFYRVAQNGLLLQPPMLMAGNNSSYSYLKWYIDHTSENLIRPWVFSLPMAYWRGLALAWACWLVIAGYAWIKQCVIISRSLLSENEDQ